MHQFPAPWALPSGLVVGEPLLEGKVFRATLGGHPVCLKILQIEGSFSMWRDIYFELRHTRLLSREEGFVEYYGHWFEGPEEGAGENLEEGELPPCPLARVCLLTSLIPGKSLGDALAEDLSMNYAGDLNMVWWTQRFMRRMASLLFTLKEHGVVHRDLKADNILLPDPLDPASAVLIDFGFSMVEGFPTHPEVDCCLGTAPYLAPEIVLSHAGSSASPVDLWALGILLFEVMHPTHQTPFEDSNDDAAVDEARARLPPGGPPREDGEIWSLLIYQRIRDRDIRQAATTLQHVPWAFDLFTRLCDSNPRTRLTVEGVLAHPFCQPRRAGNMVATMHDLARVYVVDGMRQKRRRQGHQKQGKRVIKF